MPKPTPKTYSMRSQGGHPNAAIYDPFGGPMLRSDAHGIVAGLTDAHVERFLACGWELTEGSELIGVGAAAKRCADAEAALADAEAALDTAVEAARAAGVSKADINATIARVARFDPAALRTAAEAAMAAVGADLDAAADAALAEAHKADDAVIEPIVGGDAEESPPADGGRRRRRRE